MGQALLWDPGTWGCLVHLCPADLCVPPGGSQPSPTSSHPGVPTAAPGWSASMLGGTGSQDTGLFGADPLGPAQGAVSSCCVAGDVQRMSSCRGRLLAAHGRLLGQFLCYDLSCGPAAGLPGRGSGGCAQCDKAPGPLAGQGRLPQWAPALGGVQCAEETPSPARGAAQSCPSPPRPRASQLGQGAGRRNSLTAQERRQLRGWLACHPRVALGGWW